MTFIITLISLIIERFFHWTHLRHFHWFNQYQRVLGNYFSKLPSWVLLAIYVLPLVIAVGLVNFLLNAWLYSIPKLIFGIIVLVYCMGPENFWVQALSCLNEIHKEDPQHAINRASECFQIPHSQNSQKFHLALTRALFVAAHERVFAVVFWFVILGPVGAVLYRSISLCAVQSEFGLTGTAMLVLRLLDWIPARLYTLIFALGGHFVEVLNVWKKDAKNNLQMNEKLIADCGLAALDCQDNNDLPEDGSAEKAALELLDRVFIMGLLILAMFVIMGYS